MIRYPDWQSRLQSFLLASLTRPFGYGESDCCLFAADAVLAMTGTDIAQDFRGRYHSRAGAFALVEEYAGTRSLRALMQKIGRQYELPPVSLPFAQRGDLVLLQRRSGQSLAFVALDGRSLLAAAETGFLRFPLARAAGTCAWRI